MMDHSEDMGKVFKIEHHNNLCILQQNQLAFSCDGKTLSQQVVSETKVIESIAGVSTLGKRLLVGMQRYCLFHMTAHRNAPRVQHQFS